MFLYKVKIIIYNWGAYLGQDCATLADDDWDEGADVGLELWLRLKYKI